LGSEARREIGVEASLDSAKVLGDPTALRGQFERPGAGVVGVGGAVDQSRGGE
jgi:hypothetical protein